MGGQWGVAAGDVCWMRKSADVNDVLRVVCERGTAREGERICDANVNACGGVHLE